MIILVAIILNFFISAKNLYFVSSGVSQSDVGLYYTFEVFVSITDSSIPLLSPITVTLTEESGNTITGIATKDIIIAGSFLISFSSTGNMKIDATCIIEGNT